MFPARFTTETPACIASANCMLVALLMTNVSVERVIPT